jgi:hypothetical protein
MRLTPLTDSGCGTLNCPQVYLSDRGTVVVQGAALTAAEVTLGPGEALVEIPLEIFHTAATTATAETA